MLWLSVANLELLKAYSKWQRLRDEANTLSRRPPLGFPFLTPRSKNAFLALIQISKGMGEYLKDTPEFVELELGESLVSRTETLG